VDARHAIINQISIIVVQNLALSTGAGQADAYTKAFTFFVLPHGLLAVHRNDLRAGDGPNVVKRA
jgi:hypothetical protein